MVVDTPQNWSQCGIVVLTHGTGAHNWRLVQEVLGFGIPADSLCLVHNPASTGSSLATPYEPGVARICHETGLGYAGGMNAGMQYFIDQGRPFILVLTHDTSISRSDLDMLISEMSANRHLAAIGPQLHESGTGRTLSLGGVAYRLGGVRHLRQRSKQLQSVMPCDWIDGSAILFRTQALLECGLFNSALYMYYEDAELSLRLKRAGWGLAVSGRATATQSPGQTTRWGAYMYFITRNGLYYAREIAGPVGVIWAVVKCSRRLSYLAGRAVLSRASGERNDRWIHALRGAMAGLRDGLRGDLGPPPEGLRGRGDA